MKYFLVCLLSMQLAGCLSMPVNTSPETIVKPHAMCIDGIPNMPPLPAKPNISDIRNDKEIIEQLLLEISKHRFYIYKRELELSQWLVNNLRRCQ